MVPSIAVSLKIGRSAEKTGTNASTIRYYEEIGLLPAPSRPPSAQRAMATPMFASSPSTSMP
jgi:hypothetical protein